MTHLESTLKQALRLKKTDLANARSDRNNTPLASEGGVVVAFLGIVLFFSSSNING
jgi:hypothetical protein